MAILCEAGVWRIEIEPEVATWLDNLAPPHFDEAAEAIDRLRASGNHLRMPLSRPLGDGLFELRFSCAGVARRVTYWYADWQPRLVILLTTFRKQRDVERREIDRAGQHSNVAGGHMGLHQGVMTEHADWDDIKARQAERDPRTDHDRHGSRSAASLRFELAQLVYGLRTNAGLTQRQLADRMGTTQSVISRLEQAGRLPTLELLGRIATATSADLRLLARHAGGGDANVRLSA